MSVGCIPKVWPHRRSEVKGGVVTYLKLEVQSSLEISVPFEIRLSTAPPLRVTVEWPHHCELQLLRGPSLQVTVEREPLRVTVEKLT